MTKFQRFWSNMTALDKQRFAKAVGSPYSYISGVINHHRNPSLGLALKIEAATNKAVTVYDIRDHIEKIHEEGLI